MLAAALVPPALVAGIVVMLALGAWPVGLYANLGLLGLLAGGTLGLLAWLSRSGIPSEARPAERGEPHGGPRGAAT